MTEDLTDAHRSLLKSMAAGWAPDHDHLRDWQLFEARGLVKFHGVPPRFHLTEAGQREAKGYL